jgi:hypothetical protein
LDIATDEEIRQQKEKFILHLDSADRGKAWSFIEQVKPHGDGYIHTGSIANYEDCPEIRQHLLRHLSKEMALRKCREYFHFTDSIMDKKNMEILKKVRKETQSCGVHVRRGDNAEHGVAKATDYFIKAVKKAGELWANCYFFFFSDEPEYVRYNIFPKLDWIKRKEIVDINDVNHCYRDLFLMSECKHQIASQGSMGIIAYFINKNPQKKLIAPRCTRAYNNIKPDFTIE